MTRKACGGLVAIGLLVLALSAPAAVPVSGGFQIDTGSRFATRVFYLSLFAASENLPMGWSGDVAGCNAGATSEDFKDAVMLRVNLFRALAGVPAVIDHRADYDAKAQQAALLMSANNALSHAPPNTWNCWNADGNEAAGKSNLSLGNRGWDAVYSQMRDDGDNNAVVGHRRWILYPQTRQMGTGDIPRGGGFRRANALWILDDHFAGPRPVVRDDFVAWPPRGFVPWPLVFARWSFSYPGADFSSATVRMTRNGIDVPLTLEPGSSADIGEPTLVWKPVDDLVLRPAGATRPAQDTAYEVMVGNVSVGGETRSFRYQVTVIDPDQTAAGAPLPEISGPATLDRGQPGSYRYVTAPGLSGYRLRVLQSMPYDRVEGGENGLGGLVDGSDADYPLLDGGHPASGARALHLAHPNGRSQYFELVPDFVLGDAARLRFVSRLGLATVDETARVQLSTNGGLSWVDLYTLSGDAPGSGPISTPTEAGYGVHDLDLAPWAGQVIRLRFVYDFQTGFYVPDPASRVGWLVDDIRLSDSREVTQSSVTELDESGAFPFAPVAAGDYRLQVGAAAVEGFTPSVWGRVFPVSVQVGVPPAPNGFDIDGSGGAPDAFTDGVLVFRYLLGLRGPLLTNGAIAPGGAGANAVETHLDGLVGNLDIDGDGLRLARTDGMLVIRYLLGMRGSDLISGALGAGALQMPAATIESRLAALGL